MRGLVQKTASHLVLIGTAMIISPVLERTSGRRRLSVELGEGRVRRGCHGDLAVGTMWVDHVRAVRLGSVREERGGIELRGLRVRLLIALLSMAIVVWGRDRGDVELGVVGWGVTRFWGGRWWELAIETGSVAYRGGHIGGHGWGCRGRGHAWWERHALMLWRVDGVDGGACAISTKVRKGGKGRGTGTLRKAGGMWRERRRHTFSIALLVGATFHALFPLLALRVDTLFSDAVLYTAEAGTGVVAFLAGFLTVCARILDLPAL